MSKFLLSLLLCALPLVARAQESESAQTVPRGVVQVEGGAGFARADGERETSLGDLLVRAGLDPETEVRIGVPSYVFLRGSTRASGLAMVSSELSAPYLVIRKRNWRPWLVTTGKSKRKRAGASGAQSSDLSKPALDLILGTSLPTGAREIGTDRFQPQALLAFEASLSKRVALASNLGYTSVAGQNRRFGQVFGSLAFG